VRFRIEAYVIRLPPMAMPLQTATRGTARVRCTSTQDQRHFRESLGTRPTLNRERTPFRGKADPNAMRRTVGLVLTPAGRRPLRPTLTIQERGLWNPAGAPAGKPGGALR